jgi:hypothetical protein
MLPKGLPVLTLVAIAIINPYCDFAYMALH